MCQSQCSGVQEEEEKRAPTDEYPRNNPRRQVHAGQPGIRKAPGKNSNVLHRLFDREILQVRFQLLRRELHIGCHVRHRGSVIAVLPQDQ